MNATLTTETVCPVCRKPGCVDTGENGSRHTCPMECRAEMTTEGFDRSFHVKQGDTVIHTEEPVQEPGFKDPAFGETAAHERAERIAAALNAVEGISTATLQSGVVRDLLLATLEFMDKVVNGKPKSRNSFTRLKRLVTKVKIGGDA